MLVTTTSLKWGSDKTGLRVRYEAKPTPNRHPYIDPVPRPRRQTPAAGLPGWPDTPTDQPDVETARRLALNLTQALAGRSLRAAATLTGVDHTTIGAILNGTVWPDLQTIARLEHGLDADLWPVGAARQP